MTLAKIQTILERVPELTLPCSQIDDYLKYHLHPATNGNRGRDPQQSIGLSSQSTVEEW